VAILLRRADSRELHRNIGLWALTLMGVGGTVGVGIFVLTGTIAANYAGPAVAFSFLIAGMACVCVALCYAELASTLPIAGSAYTYTYASMGEVVAWTVGWNLVLEYIFAAAAVAIGWSGYFTALLQELAIAMPPALTSPPLELRTDSSWGLSGGWLNLPAALIVFAITALLTRDMRFSARFNAAIVVLKISVILAVVVFGARYVDIDNWRPFVPENAGAAGEFGWTGIMRGAGVAFFAYVGFDMLSAGAQEVRNPERNIPLGLFLTLAICTALYVSMALIITGLISYRELDVPHPLSVAIANAGAALAWLRPLVSGSLVLCLSAGIFLALYGQTRICYAMSVDGLIPRVFSRLSSRRRVPLRGTWIVGSVTALIAATVPLQVLGELLSIGTLMAFGIVCIAVLVLRHTDPDMPRAFRTPFAPFVPVIGATICLYLMVSLPWATWLRLFAWLAVGSLIYTLYGRRHSLVAADVSNP
jgi:APA family basic amino acid/polyamine antiporter